MREIANGKRAIQHVVAQVSKARGVTSQQEIERIVRERHLEGKGKLKVKMVLTADGTDLRHEVDGEIDLG